MNPRLLNVGCGRSHHPAWINLDLASSSPEVIECDLRRGIPLPDGHCDAVYHSHVLEHLREEDGATMLRECFRVTRPGGIVRVAVPDLERIARDYLRALESAASGGDAFAHRWMLLEMYDQAVRGVSGGRMAEVIRSASPSEYGLIRSRLGAEAAGIRTPETGGRPARRSYRRLVQVVLGRLRRLGMEGASMLLGGAGAVAAVREGLFRQSGEIHVCMYDRVRLAAALARAGYVDPRPRSAGESDIPGFGGFGLETVDGLERKPDSLYMEAKRPAA